MNNWQEIHSEKLLSLESAVGKLASGDKIWAGGLLSIPVVFLKELDKHLDLFSDCEIYTGLMTTPFEFLKPQYRDNFKHISLFMGPIERKLQSTGNVEVTNFHFSNFENIFEKLQPNTVVVEVTPPNADGFVSLGACGGVATKVALKHASKVIFVVNEQQPFIGNEDNIVHVDCADALVEGHHSIASPKAGQPSELETEIAKHVSPYIKDGMTVQIGIGTISNAMGMALRDRKDLGVHTEMFTESLMEMCKAGAVSGTKKNHMPNKIVAAFAAGPQEVMDFLHNNPDIEMGSMSEVVNPYEVAKNDNFVSINTCLMIDLVGQVASEGAGFSQISGSGGQLDFVRAANMAKNGVSILALAATREGKDGLESNIRLSLPVGTPITTPRNDVHIVATEYGSVNLRGMTVSERVHALANIAHPDFRESLLAEAKQHGLVK
ncbi:4-hydroxybutyrate CoA-transferase [Vibrio coralliirubri]|uniref:acetyl-CoA hydrolase/transferase family protein n=1 Tax=Vibrio TaxID=662 RepID=UPI000633AA85|nr:MULTISPECIES: acetyl-CoA hydrolase/transferase C-terminal domain-containing protein [Vibrio]MCK8079338.1 4-hydroxybutyrate CoA-transferase [Vibrio sp. 1CM24A]CDT94548.1 4-hydroxybutyrate CoA-transferase [Vibrio coralliirubri]